ncbi:MAG: DPP IV N-terminal domain-containing protein [Myxococcota bacterium]
MKSRFAINNNLFLFVSAFLVFFSCGRTCPTCPSPVKFKTAKRGSKHKHEGKNFQFTTPKIVLDLNKVATGAYLGKQVRKLKWSPDAKFLTFLKAGKDNFNDLWAYDFKNNKLKPLVKSKDVADKIVESAREKAARERQRMSRTGIVSYYWHPSGQKILFPLSGDLYLYNLKTNKTEKITNDSAAEIDPTFSPDGKKISYVKQGNLYVQMLAEGKTFKIAQSKDKNITFGLSEFVAQEEMGRYRGYWWSPDSRHLAFLKVDENQVPIRKRIEVGSDSFKVVKQRYPSAGKHNAKVETGVVGFRGGKIRWFKLPAYEYIPRVKWINKNQVAIQTQNRSQQELKLNRCRIANGKCSTIITEVDEAWVELNKDLRFFKKSNKFFFSTEQWKQKYCNASRFNAMKRQCGSCGYFQKAKLPNSFTKFRLKQFSSEQLNQIKNNCGECYKYIEATAKSRLTKNLYLGWYEKGKLQRKFMPLQNGYWFDKVIFHDEKEQVVWVSVFYRYGKEKLIFKWNYNRSSSVIRAVSGTGWHSALVAPDGRKFLHRHSNIHTGEKLLIRDASGKLLKKVPPVEKFDPLVAKLPKPRELTIKVEDSQLKGVYIHLNALEFKPRSRQKGVKKHPAIVNVYGGPHGHYVRRKNSTYNLWAQYMAGKGFYVLIVDGRGGTYRDREFAKAPYHNFGKFEIEDSMAAYNYLYRKHDVDGNRIGVWGWSYGGYAVMATLLRAKPTYAAGVAIAPPTDWTLYDTHYTERYLGLPNQVPKVYKRANINEKELENLSSPFLIMHGMSDDNVLLQNSLRVFKSFQDKKIPFEMMLYPGRAHSLWGDNTRFHVLDQITSFFTSKLMIIH